MTAPARGLPCSPAFGLALAVLAGCLSLEPLSSYESGLGAGGTEAVAATEPANMAPAVLPPREPHEASAADAGLNSGEELPNLDTSQLGPDASPPPPSADAGAPCAGAGEFLSSGGSSCYRLVATPVSAAAAATACTAWGGDLVEIDSAAEDAFLSTRIGAQVWIGANDRVTEGTMVWSNGSPLQYANWAMGQPDNYLGAEDCAVKLSPAGSWNDTSCASLNAYVCERPAT
jgi:hypothetical protein